MPLSIPGGEAATGALRRIDQNGPEDFGANWFSVEGATPVSPVAAFYNATGGASAISFQRAADDTVPSGFVGLAAPEDDAPQVLQMLAQAPASATAPPDVHLVQCENGGAAHLRLACDGVAQTMTAYGWNGEVGWHLGAGGVMGIGTNSLDDGCSLTVAGSGNVSLHAETVQLTSPTAEGPSLLGGTQLLLQTADHASSLLLRSSADANEYNAPAGTMAGRTGHRFRTGSTPATRFTIADDGVALDTPLKLQARTLDSLPAAADCAGCLVVVTDHGATAELTYSDGVHWLNLNSGDVVA